VGARADLDGMDKRKFPALLDNRTSVDQSEVPHCTDGYFPKAKRMFCLQFCEPM